MSTKELLLILISATIAGLATALLFFLGMSPLVSVMGGQAISILSFVFYGFFTGFYRSLQK
jgi:hypothetical protein